jgi:hypothetical protein
MKTLMPKKTGKVKRKGGTPMTELNPYLQGPSPFLNKVLPKSLPQKEDLWQGDEYSSVGTEGCPPLWLVWVTSPFNDLILVYHTFEEEPVSDLLWDTLVQAMQEEGYRPTKLRVRPNERWKSLKPRLHEIGISLVVTDNFDGVDGVPELIDEVFLAWEEKHGKKPGGP